MKTIDLEEITIEELWEKIHKARNWALDHFNAREADNPNIVDYKTGKFMKASAFVEFPTPDCMIVTPSILGKPSLMCYYFHLSFCSDKTMEWNTRHLFYRTPMPPLKVK